MKKLLFGIMVCISIVESIASPMIAGQIITVQPSGASDISRNPALLSLQKNEVAFSSSVKYRIISNYDIDADISINSNTDESTDTKISETLHGDLSVGVSFKLDSSTIGFGIYSGKDKLYSDLKNDVKYSGFNGGSNISLDQLSEENVFNPSLVFVYSKNTSKNFSYGIQFKSSYLQENKNSNSKLVVGGVVNFDKEIDVKKKVYGLEMSLGFHKKMQNSEVGIFMSPVGIVYESVLVSYDVKLNNNVNLFDGEQNFSSNIYKESGFRIIAGSSYRFNNMFEFYIETGYFLPHLNVKAEYDFDDINNKINEKNADENVSGVFIFKSGTDITISESFKYSFGFGLTQMDSSSNSKDGSIGKTNILILDSSTGFDYFLSSKSFLTFGGKISYVMMNIEKNDSNMNMVMDTSILGLDLFLSFSHGI